MKLFVFNLMLLLQSLITQSVQADELRPAYLQLSETGDNSFDILWRVPAVASKMRLSIDVVFDEKTTNQTEVFDIELGGTSTRHWQAERVGGLRGLLLSIKGLSRTNSEVIGRIEFLDGTAIIHRFTPDAPNFLVTEMLSWSDTAGVFFGLGLEHILYGIDHLLFVFALMLLVKGKRRLIATVTAFTLAHSITLALASLEVIYVPILPVEACIALSIVFVAGEIIRSHKGDMGIATRNPWAISFFFGLLHGLGFASALGEIGLPQNDIPTALIMFNVGVEAGQLLFVFCILMIWVILRKFSIKGMPTWIYQIPAYLIGTIASFWTIERIVTFWA